MSKIFSSEELIGEISFLNTISIEDYIFGEISFLGTSFFGTVYGELDFVQDEEPQFPYIAGSINFIDPNYFPSLSAFDEEDPLPEELCASFGSNVYAICPDIAQGWQIPYSELLECNVSWYANTPITGNIKLKNSDRKYTNPDDANFGGIFTEEEIWSNTKNSRKYLFIEQMSKCDDKVNYLLFPRLVITSVSGTHTLNINFVDEISYYLFYRKVTFPTYCFEEALIRIDSTHYASYNLTEFYYTRNGTNKQSEFYINSEIKTPYALDLVENIITVSPEIENENIPVVLRNPKLVKELISDVVKKVIDTQEGNITKEYLQVEMYFQDFFIYSNVEIQNSDVISVLKKDLFDAIPADFLIRPILNYLPNYTTNRDSEATYLAISGLKPTLVIQDCLLEDEFYTPTYRIPESIVRGETEPQLTGLKKFNSQKIMKPGIIGKSYVLEVSEVSTDTGDVPTEIPPIISTGITILPIRLYPIIPYYRNILTETLYYGSINDITEFMASDISGNVTDYSPKYSFSELFPDGYLGTRSGNYNYGVYGSWLFTIYWDEPIYSQSYIDV